MGAVAVPPRLAALQFNVVHGAQGGTLAAADAAVVHRKCPVMDAGGVKNRVDDIGHKLAKHRGFRFRFSAQNRGNVRCSP